MKTRIATRAFVSSWIDSIVQRDPKRMAITEKLDETMLNQLKSILMPCVFSTSIGVEPTFKIKSKLELFYTSAVTTLKYSLIK